MFHLSFLVFFVFLIYFFSSQEVSRNPELSENDAAKLVAAHIKSKEPKNYGYYRVSSLRSIAGGCKLRPKMDSKLKVVSDHS